MPEGTESPRHWPANTGEHDRFGVKYRAFAARSSKVQFSWYLLNGRETFTLYADATLGDRGFNIDAGSSIAQGDMIELFEDGHIMQATVTNFANDVGFDTVTIDTPLNFAYTILGALGRAGDPNNAVDGDDPDVAATIIPPPNELWEVNNLLIQLHDQTAMDSSLFGGITALTQGLVIRVYRSATAYENLDNIKSNEDFFEQGWQVEYPANVLTDHYLIRANKAFGPSGFGEVIQLDGNLGEYLEVLVSDDISGLDSAYFVADGYVRNNEIVHY